jgi:hypothetical protein
MAVLKYSLVTIFVLSSCAVVQKATEVKINNTVNGCFSITRLEAALADPTLIRIAVSPNSSGDCPCKSALLKYTVVQKVENHENFLMSGHFSPLGIDELTLPLSVQSRLIVQGSPVSLNVACSLN